MKINDELRTLWIPVNSQIREEVVYKVKLTDLSLQDKYYQFSALTEQDLRIFSNVFQKTRPYEFPDRVHVQITFEFDLNLHRIDRDVYSFLDWVGDVGGLNEGLYLGLKVVLIFFQFHDFEHFLIERLYTHGDANGSPRRQRQRNFNVKNTSWCRQRCNYLCCCLRIKLTREERLFSKARR